MQRKPINFETDPYIKKKEREMKTASEQQERLDTERKKLLDRLEVVEQKLGETFSVFHNARSDIEVYQETGRRP